MHCNLRKQQHSGIKHVQAELLAKIRNPGNLKLQMAARGCKMDDISNEIHAPAKTYYSNLNYFIPEFLLVAFVISLPVSLPLFRVLIFISVAFHPNMVFIIASYCGTHVHSQSVANMAARRSGSLLFQRCIFCSRETLKQKHDFVVSTFSRIGNTASSRSGILFSAGENLHPYNLSSADHFFGGPRHNFDKILSSVSSAPSRKINPSFFGAISSQRGFHTSG